MTQSIAGTIEEAPALNKHYLINMPTDYLTMGGLSIITFVIITVFYDKQDSTAEIAVGAYYLAFIANFPHFLASYQLLYSDFRKFIFKDFRFFWAAVIAPIILAAFCIGGVVFDVKPIISNLPNVMYFFVGWHYVKQIFGGIIVSSVLQGIFFRKLERRVLQCNLYSLWAISWVNSNLQATSIDFYGVKYTTFQMPPICLTLCYWAVGVSLLLVVITQVKKYRREKVAPTHSAFICFATIYLWFLPTMYNPLFFYLIPFFHSLQYLPFVYAFRRNKVSQQIGEVNTPQKQRFYALRVYGYMVLAVILGAIVFQFLPDYIDNLNLFSNPSSGPMTAMFLFMIFINIHHYFIDNVIWKGSNPEVKKYLFR